MARGVSSSDDGEVEPPSLRMLASMQQQAGAAVAGTIGSFGPDDVEGPLAQLVESNPLLDDDVPGGVEEGQEQPPPLRYVESNLWCWGRSQDGQAGACR